MGGLKGRPGLYGLGVLLAVLVVFGGYARADVTTDQPGSIIVFPKVIADGTRDTLITITNVRNMPSIVHCIYNNSPSGTCSLTTTQGCRFNEDCPTTETCNLITPGVCSITSTRGCSVDADCPGSEPCVHECVEHDFDIFLTGQQPTVWDVASGRQVNPVDNVPGLDPGNVPPQIDFVGELKCYVTDADGAPIMQNSLTGEASLFGAAGPSTDVSEYNGVTIFAAGTPAGNLDLNNIEYNACPADLVVNHWADGAVDSFTGATINTELTLVPCTEDFESQIPPPARAIFDVSNEFEEHLSASVPVGCFLNRQLSDLSIVFKRSTLKSDFAKTRITPPSAKLCYTGTNRGAACTSDSDCPDFTTLGCRPRPGLLAVSEEFHQVNVFTPTTAPGVATAAANAYVEGSRAAVGGDVIVIPSLDTSGQ